MCGNVLGADVNGRPGEVHPVAIKKQNTITLSLTLEPYHNPNLNPEP